MYAFGEAALLCSLSAGQLAHGEALWAVCQGELESLPTPDSEAMQVIILRHLAGGPEGLADTIGPAAGGLLAKRPVDQQPKRPPC